MKFNPRGLLEFRVAAALVLWTSTLHSRTVPVFEFALRIALWTLLFVLSAAAVGGMFRLRRLTPLGPDGAVRELLRWSIQLGRAFRQLFP